jgi:hypothetical protein
MSEYSFIASVIKELLLSSSPPSAIEAQSSGTGSSRTAPLRPSDIAVLYRTNALGKSLRAYLKKFHRDVGVDLQKPVPSDGDESGELRSELS